MENEQNNNEQGNSTQERKNLNLLHAVVLKLIASNIALICVLSMFILRSLPYLT
jgi:hypothetical protein